MPKPMVIVREVVLWILALFLAWIFLKQGWSKFDDGSGWSKAFRAWHYPDWFRITIGVLEVGAALLLITRKFAFAGALIIVVVMLGGMATHVRFGHPKQVTSELLPLVFASVIAIGRRP